MVPEFSYNLSDLDPEGTQNWAWTENVVDGTLFSIATPAYFHSTREQLVKGCRCPVPSS